MNEALDYGFDRGNILMHSRYSVERGATLEAKRPPAGPRRVYPQPGCFQTYSTNKQIINNKIKWVRMSNTGSSEINGAKLSDACSVRAHWLCMGWPFCLAEMRREFQTGKTFLHHAVRRVAAMLPLPFVATFNVGVEVTMSEGGTNIHQR